MDVGEVAGDFAQVLLREPGKVATFRLRVRDIEWGEDPEAYDPRPERKTRNEFGWDGEAFLGAENVWCFDAAGVERPARYEDYLR